MLSITRGRSLATAPAGSVGDESIPRSAQPPGLVPSESPRAGCPATPRPRNLPEYQAACRSAAGERVEEIDACQVIPGMRVWHNSHFLAVSSNLRDGSTVELLLTGPGYVASRYCALDTPLYRLV